MKPSEIKPDNEKKYIFSVPSDPENDERIKNSVKAFQASDRIWKMRDFGLNCAAFLLVVFLIYMVFRFTSTL